MKFNTRYILEGTERKDRHIRHLYKGELNHLTVFFMLKNRYSNGVIVCPSKHKLAQSLGIHYSTLEKSIEYLKSNNLLHWTTCNKVRAIRMGNMVRGCEYQGYNPKVIRKFRKSKIDGKSFDEVKAFLANIIIDISCSQQKYRVDQRADQTFLGNSGNIHSKEDLKKRNKINRSLNGSTGATRANLLVTISDSYIAKTLGTSRPTANKLKHRIQNLGFGFFSTIEEYIKPMTKVEFKQLREYGELTNKYYIKNGMLAKTVGTCYYNLYGKMNKTYKIKRISTLDAMEIIIGNRKVMRINDMLKSQMIAAILSDRKVMLDEIKRINNSEVSGEEGLRES